MMYRPHWHWSKGERAPAPARMRQCSMAGATVMARFFIAPGYWSFRRFSTRLSSSACHSLKNPGLSASAFPAKKATSRLP